MISFFGPLPPQNREKTKKPPLTSILSPHFVRWNGTVILPHKDEAAFLCSVKKDNTIPGGASRQLVLRARDAVGAAEETV